MRFLTYIVLSLVFLSCVSNTQTNKQKEIDLKSEIFVPLHYIVPKTTEPIIIDGMADEEQWHTVPFTKSFMDIEGIKQPKYNTQVKMLWDDAFLYVYALLEEPHIWGTLKQRDTVIFYNNDFEIFLDPSNTTYNYGEIEVNALNTIWDLKLDKPYRVGGKPDNSWNLDHLKCAVHLEGTLNLPNDTDSFWAVEMAIPHKPIMKLKGSLKDKPANGEQWRINFSRVEWDFDIINGRYDRKKMDGKYLPEYNWVWSPQGVINMHEPEKWGFLQFTGQPSIENVAFRADKDLIFKQAAYALFRLTRFGSLKYLLEAETEYKEQLTVVLSDEITTKAVFEKTKNGFSFFIHHPKTNMVFMINQDGWLKMSK
ncbi:MULTISPECIES: carbohydrate-binding family 9-like protein [unclassified Saccharicrinis]|uniref:carbohydrate-binding family 9-like protein n=1 Tax=unclassified Saccharicrinis TaxID=2646859 RepID=UPI003D3383A2